MDVSRRILVLDTFIFMHFSDKYFRTEGVLSKQFSAASPEWSPPSLTKGREEKQSNRNRFQGRGWMRMQMQSTSTSVKNRVVVPLFTLSMTQSPCRGRRRGVRLSMPLANNLPPRRETRVRLSRGGACRGQTGPWPAQEFQM